MEKLDGTIETITFQNEDNGYCVLKVLAGGELFTCVGTAPMVSQGLSVRLEGEWSAHKRFGRQFAFENYEIVRPTTLDGISRLLESGLIKNIGAARARMIVDKFGMDTLSVLDNTPDRLSEIPGLGRKTLKKIKTSWNEQRHIRDLVIFLQGYDIPVSMANRIYKTYGAESKKRICENPYTLISDIWGIGFIKADAVAVKMGFDAASYKRIKAGLTYALQEAAGNGHTYLPREDLVAAAAELLKLEADNVAASLDHCIKNEKFIDDDGSVYLPYLYRAETEVAKWLREKIECGMRNVECGIKVNVKTHREAASSSGTVSPASRPALSRGGLAPTPVPLPTPKISNETINEFISYYQEKNGWVGAPEQLEAVRLAAKNKVFILTGGPGTGKTTVLQVIVAYFRQQKLKIELAAPTGRAAARMGSISGVVARTIHRLLEFKPDGGGKFKFTKCEENPIDTDVIILDEVSMIDIQLMKSFLCAVKRDTALLLVGDSNQLPSVGPGNVLSDLISCGAIPHIQLTRIFRQSAQSRIVTAAHEIITGRLPHFSNAASDNCFLMTEDEPQKCLDKIVDIVCRRLPARYRLDSMTDIQVLTPMHKGTLGTVNMNAALQKALNKNSKKVQAGQHMFMLGDRVIQTKNNYDLGVFNGDIGFITAIADDEVAVTFDKSPVFYNRRDLDQLIHAYCVSIHKSQGSEFKAVVIPISTQHYVMLQRNLIYTALTRAKELCILVGTKGALSIAVRNDKALTRNSRLKERVAIG